MQERGRIIEVDSQGRVQRVEAPGVHEARERLKKLAWLFDSSIPIPGTRLTVGLDALIGLIPVLGDLIGVALSSLILAGQPPRRAEVAAPGMAANAGTEGLVGTAPFTGHGIDAVFKANSGTSRCSTRGTRIRAKRTARAAGSARFCGDRSSVPRAVDLHRQ